MKFTKNTIAVAAALAVASSLTLENTEMDPIELAQAQAQDLVLDVTEGVTEIITEIVNAASGNVDGICWKNSYVVHPQLGNTCLDGWEKVGALCYEDCREGYQHDGPAGTICFECRDDYHLRGGVCWKLPRSHIPLSTYNRGVEV